MTGSWDGRANLTSYDEVEAPTNYRSAAELEAYRAERLAFGVARARFALAQTAVPVPTKVIEVGAGSSALLYAMELDGALEHAIAIEISRTRYGFAERWKADKSFKRVQNRCADFATVAFDPGWADLFLCLDNTFSYLGPEEAAYPRTLIDKAYATLRPGGALIIEIHNQEKVIGALRDDERQFWVELASTNAFKFALYRQTLDRAKNWLRSESIYLGENGDERRKVDLETIYDRAAIEALLSAAGFGSLQIFGDYSGAPFDASRSDYLIALARKPAR
jgi:SAM-dependent methyltransferase